jgi:hypothetical protein
VKSKDFIITESELFCTAYGCPKGNRDKDCPLSTIEYLSFNKRIDWIYELDDEKEEAI